jgi:hypothetical protein
VRRWWATATGLWQTPAVGDDKGGFDARSLVAADGGEWHGLLFDNPAVRLPAALTWTLRIPFAPVDGEPVTLHIDWLPVEAGDWRSMSGQHAVSPSFAEPAEASLQHAGHHRYDRVEVRVTEQRDTLIRVTVTLAGDLDGLGPDTVTADAWLRFTGIAVQLSDVASAEQARQRLAEVTDTTGLVEAPDARGIAFRFEAAG